jgi:hypothetical protein
MFTVAIKIIYFKVSVFLLLIKIVRLRPKEESNRGWGGYSPILYLQQLPMKYNLVSGLILKSNECHDRLPEYSTIHLVNLILNTFDTPQNRRV